MADDRPLTAVQGAELIGLIKQLPDAIAAAIIRADRRRVPHGPDRDALLRLARETHAAVGDRLFTSRELMTHANLPQCLALRSAIEAVVVGAKKPVNALGKALARIADTTFDDIRVEACGGERGGVIWRASKLLR